MLALKSIKIEFLLQISRIVILLHINFKKKRVRHFFPSTPRTRRSEKGRNTKRVSEREREKERK